MFLIDFFKNPSLKWKTNLMIDHGGYTFHFDSLSPVLAEVCALIAQSERMWAWRFSVPFDQPCHFRCARKTQAVRQTRVLKAPAVLIVQLKRFNAYGGKIRQPIAAEVRLEGGDTVVEGVV